MTPPIAGAMGYYRALFRSLEVVWVCGGLPPQSGTATYLGGYLSHLPERFAGRDDPPIAGAMGYYRALLRSLEAVPVCGVLLPQSETATWEVIFRTCRSVC